GPAMPRVFAVIALVVEIEIVARPPRRIAHAVRAHAVQAVVALIRLEAAFGDAHADDRLRIDAESLHALDVGFHVGLAGERGAHAERAQVIAHGHLADLEWKAVPRRAVRLHVAAGIGAHPRRAADRRLHMRPGEAHAAPGEAVDMRRREMRMAVAGQVIPAELVAHDEQDVFRLFGHARHPPDVACPAASGSLAGMTLAQQIAPAISGMTIPIMPDAAEPMIPTPFVSSVMRVEPAWIDYNGHLNMAYYNVLFDRAVDE